MKSRASAKWSPHSSVLGFSLATCLSLCIATPYAQAAPNRSDSRSIPTTNPTVVYLDFFHRWDTPLDDAAARAFSRIVNQAADFKSFAAIAPTGSDERRLFERHLAPFEEAGLLIRSGQMNEDLFFDAWYDTPSSWKRAQPYVLGMRQEVGNPQIYRGFEWLAQHAEEFWSRREKNPPHWQPIGYSEPTAADQAIFAAFNEIWSTPRDTVARAFFVELQDRAKSFDEFSRMVPSGSQEYIKFDRVLCAYDQAGTLIKNGILHPKLFFNSWQSPTEIWRSAEPWVKGIRARGKNPHVYDNVDWLIGYEIEWRSNATR